MGEFRFSLQQILDLRTKTVKDIEIHLEETYGKRQKLRNFLLEEREGYFSDRQQLNAELQTAKGDAIGIFDTSLELRKRRMLQILEYLKEVESDLDLLNRALIQAKQELKTVENLKEKKFQEHMKNEEIRERKLLDEQAIQRFLRSHYNEDREER